MNLFVPFAFELFQFALMYVPNICSDKGGICTDVDTNLMLINVLDNVTTYLMYPINIISNAVTLYLDTVLYVGESNAKDMEQLSLIEYIFNFISSFFVSGSPEITEQQNYVGLFHIAVCYIVYVCLAKKAIRKMNVEPVKTRSLFEAGDYDVHVTEECNDLICHCDGAGEKCYCHMECICSHDDDDESED